MIEKMCEICGNTYRVKNYRAATSRFCSQHCMGVSLRGKPLPEMDQSYKRGNKWRKGKRPSNAFGPGHDAWNKGLKGIHLSPDSEFKRGHPSAKRVDVGTERVRLDKKTKRPRVWIKIAEPNKWKLRAVLVWEKANGPVPAGCVVHHLDRNSTNDNISNLECMTRAEHLLEHRSEFETDRLAGLRRRAAA